MQIFLKVLTLLILAVHSLASPPTTPTQESVLIRYKNVEQLLTVSSANKLVEQSQNAQALLMRNQARDLHKQAGEAMEVKDWQTANNLLIQASQTMFAAVKTAGTGNLSLEDKKRHYLSLMASVNALKDALLRVAQEKNKKPQADSVIQNANDIIQSAEQIAQKQDYVQARQVLNTAYMLIKNAIFEIKNGETAIAPKKTFATAEEEFAWELERFDSYLTLLKIIKSKKTGTEAQWLERQIEESTEIREKAISEKSVESIKAETLRLMLILKRYGLTV